jgi:hypothetical protein
MYKLYESLSDYLVASKRILTFYVCFETAQIGCSSLDILYSPKKMKILSVSYVLWLNFFKLASGTYGGLKMYLSVLHMF